MLNERVMTRPHASMTGSEGSPYKGFVENGAGGIGMGWKYGVSV
jgi:hypothetical protein